MTKAELDAILAKPTTTVPIAGRVLGIGTTRSYQSARNGELRVIEMGRKKLVPTAWLREVLGLGPLKDVV